MLILFTIFWPTGIVGAIESVCARFGWARQTSDAPAGRDASRPEATSQP
jgi:hypothetical protein